jgi:gamma-glutamylcyclotransferase (GGCT)/AIG2-like uncharacterized protein YtfP
MQYIKQITSVLFLYAVLNPASANVTNIEYQGVILSADASDQALIGKAYQEVFSFDPTTAYVNDNNVAAGWAEAYGGSAYSNATPYFTETVTMSINGNVIVSAQGAYQNINYIEAYPAYAYNQLTSTVYDTNANIYAYTRFQNTNGNIEPYSGLSWTGSGTDSSTPTAESMGISNNNSSFNLSGNVTSVTLNQTPVPIPAAIWLFGSVLAGFRLSVRRKSV